MYYIFFTLSFLVMLTPTSCFSSQSETELDIQEIERLEDDPLSWYHYLSDEMHELIDQLDDTDPRDEELCTELSSKIAALKIQLRELDSKIPKQSRFKKNSSIQEPTYETYAFDTDQEIPAHKAWANGDWFIEPCPVYTHSRYLQKLKYYKDELVHKIYRCMPQLQDFYPTITAHVNSLRNPHRALNTAYYRNLLQQLDRIDRRIQIWSKRQQKLTTLTNKLTT